MKITREPLFSDLVAFATTGNGVVIGRPGAGKTFALRELSRRLKEQAVSHLLLPVERLGQASPAEITALFQREGDFGGILRDAVGNKGPGVLIFDGYDAARGENERSGVFQLIARAVTELAGYWHVLVSVRTFDAKKSQRLLDLFPDRTSKAGSTCRQFEIPLLSSSEVQQAIAQIPQLGSLQKNGTDEFRALLTVPFNLWLVERSLHSGAPTADFSHVTSEVQLLEMYWNYRIRRGPAGPNKEYLVKRAAAAMVDSHTLTVSRDRVYTPETKEAWDKLLSEEVLTENAASAAGVSFAHNILFDFAVSVHLLDDQPEKIVEFVAKEPARPLFLRPSLVYHYTRLWHFKRPIFWQNFWSVIQSDQAHLRQIVRLVLPSVVVSEANEPKHLKPLLDPLHNPSKPALDAIAFVLQALRVLKTKRYSLWSSFFADPTFKPDRRFAWDAGTIATTLLEEAGPSAISVQADGGTFGRRLLNWAWTNRADPEYGKWLERMAGIVAIPLVARTYPTDPKESRRLLDAVVAVIGELDFPIDTIFRFVNEVEHLVAHDPSLVRSIFEHVFGFEERSEAKTNMGGPVLPLISNRRQDYDSCRYSLIQEFPNFLANAPQEAVRAAVRSLQVFVLDRHVLPYLRQGKKPTEITEEFEFRGQTTRYIHDGASIWDKTSYPDQEMALADALFNWLEEAAEAGRTADLETVIHAVSEEGGVAVLWARLLAVGAKQPASRGMLLWELATAKPVKDGIDALRPLGSLLEAITALLTPEQRAKIESAILEVPLTEDQDKKEAYEYRRNRLLARLPAVHLVTHEAKALHEELTQAKKLPPNSPLVSFSSSNEPYTEEIMLRQRGIETDTPANAEIRALYSPLQEWSEKEKKDSEIDPLLETTEKLRARLKESTEADELVLALGATYLASFASDALLRTKDAKSDRFKLLREINLENAAHPLPEPDPEQDAKWKSAMWSSAPRIEAAQALAWLTHFDRDEEAFAAIERLVQDSVPAVRFLAVADMWRLSERYADKLWPLLGKIVETEANPVVLQGATQALWELSRRDPASAADVVRSLLGRVLEEDEEVEEKAQTNLIHLVVAYAVVHDAAWAKATLDDWRKMPVKYAQKLGVSGRRLIEYVKPYHFERENPVFLRAQAQLLVHLDAVADGIAELQKPDAKLDPDGLRKTLRRLYDVVNHAVMWTYFSSDVDPQLRQRTEFPLDDTRREKFFSASLPVLNKVISFGTNKDTGMLLAPTAHYFMQLLNGVLRYNPSLVLKMASDVVTSSKRFNFTLDPMALREAVELVESLLADHRAQIQDDASIKNLLELLDSFVEVGWPEALQLVWRLDEIYR